MSLADTIIAGAVGAGVVQAAQYLRERLVRTRVDLGRKITLSGTISQQLETFAIACAVAVEDNLRWNPATSGGATPHLHQDLPLLEAPPEDADLSLLARSNVARLIALPVRIRLGRVSVQAQHDVDGPTGAVEETTKQCGVCGYEALELAQLIREDAQLPAPDYRAVLWDFGATLEAHSQHVMAVLSEIDAPEPPSFIPNPSQRPKRRAEARHFRRPPHAR